MTSRRNFLIGLGALGAAATLTVPVLAIAATPTGATAVTRVYGDGLRFVAVALAYDGDVAAGELDAGAYAVEGRTVTGVYPSTSADPADKAESGPFVIVELSDADAAAVLKSEPERGAPPAGASTTGGAAAGGSGGPSWSAGDPNVSGTTWTEPAATVVTPEAEVTTSAVANLVVDGFEQRVWNDPVTGDTLAYNLFIPANYDPAQSYPLVNFMHDAGACSEDPTFTLKQGLGAISWASPTDQAARPAFVLAPQFAEIVADDNSNASSMLDTVVNLITALTQEFSIDPARLYTTGQSGGGMLSIAMNIKYPDFFAATFLVACQWDAALVAPMAGNRIFIVVSEDDSKAFPGQTAITDALEAAGASVARATWDATWDAEQYQTAFDDLIAEGARVNFVAFAAGTVFPAGASTEGASGHQNTWRVAYTIEPIRDWILRTNL